MSHVNSWNYWEFVGFWITVALFFGGFVGLPIAVSSLWRKLRHR